MHPPAAEWSSPSKVTPEEATTGEQQHNNNNSGYAITREIAKHDDWNSTEIRKRCKEMAREAISLWPLPKKYNEDVAASAWQIMDDSTEDLFNHLCEIIKEYDPSIYEDPKKQSINFVKDKKVVLSLIPCQSYLLVTLNARIDQLTPNDNLEDISEKGHWGVGNTRMRLRNEDDNWQVLDYIEQIVGTK